MHTNDILLFQKYCLPLFKPGLRVLEIGPDKHPSTLQQLVADRDVRWETVDIATEITDQLTYRATSEYSFPIGDGEFDIVLSANVMEHVKKIWVWIREVARVCKPGGRVITILPVSWPYHPFPVDCWRIYPEGMKALYEEAGLQIELNVCETLEIPLTGSRRQVPLHTHNPSTPLRRAVKRLLGWPVEYALDTIAIGVKVPQK